jgi:hypothetical protein
LFKRDSINTMICQIFHISVIFSEKLDGSCYQ